jgi:hypothetical protein
MNRPSRILIFLTACVLTLMALFAGLWEYGNRTSAIRLRRSKESFEAAVAQALPPGSDNARVEQFLDSMHMTHVDTTPISDKNAASNNVASLIEATSRDKIESLLGSCSISAKFNFDSRGVLLGYNDWDSCKWIW